MLNIMNKIVHTRDQKKNPSEINRGNFTERSA